MPLAWQGALRASSSATRHFERACWGAVADADGDGGADLLWYSSNPGRTATLWRMKAGIQQSIRPGARGLYGSGIWRPVLADVTGDGKVDILWDQQDIHGRSTGTRSLWLSRY